MTRAGALILAGALIAAGIAAASPTQSRIVDAQFHSKAIDAALHYEVYLPADYATGAKAYPVVYFLHGLPAGAKAYQSLGFVERALDQTGDGAILVIPQAARYNEPDPEYVDRAKGDRWETAIGTELPAVIDARYRTIATRNGRAIIGLSAGGFGAMHIGVADLQRFGVIESWSGYFHPTDPTGLRALDLGSKQLDAVADVHAQARQAVPKLPAQPILIAFYVGRDDTRFEAENEQLNQELSRAGIPHVFRIYPGGHDQRLWSRYAPEWLALALHRLAPAR
jgi:S-formylglutathione hydrolase FrmB